MEPKIMEGVCVCVCVPACVRLWGGELKLEDQVHAYYRSTD